MEKLPTSGSDKVAFLRLFKIKRIILLGMFYFFDTRKSGNLIQLMTKKISLYVLLILAFTLVPGCASFLTSQMIDSHKGMSCMNCHTAKPEKTAPNLKHPKNPSRMCMKCHEYLKNQDHHPSEIELDSSTTLPSHFKLYNGKWIVLPVIRCIAETTIKREQQTFL